MNKILKSVLASVFAVSLIFSTVGCGASNSASSSGTSTTGASTGNKDLPVLRVAIMPTVTSLPTYYIKANKLDEKAGFKIETTMFTSGAPMNEALAANLWDVGAMGAAAVTGVANYDEMIIGEVLESTDGQGVFVRADSKIAKAKGYNPSYPNVLGDPASVKGSTILLPIGTAQHFTVLKWLEKIGLKNNDVNIVNMDTVQAYQSLKAGQCDAVSLNVPTFFTAKKDGMVQVANLAELGTRYVDMVVANRKSLDSKSELVQKYMNCIFEACAALQADPNKSAELLEQYLKESGAETSKENCLSDISRVKFLAKDDWKNRDLGKFAKELAEFYISVGQLDASVMDKFKTNIVSTYVK